VRYAAFVIAMTKIILLPGMDGTGDLFRPLLSVIPSNVSTRVISYPTDQALSYRALFDLIVEQLSGEREMVLVAESFSGPLALQFAAQHPSRIQAVVLCATFVHSPVPRALRYFVSPPLFRVPVPAAVVRRLMIGPGADASLVRQVQRAIRRVRPRVLAQRMRDVLRVNAEDALRQCAAPILYIAARQDAQVPASAIERIRAIRKDVRVATLDGPHLLLQAKPAECWRVIAAFLNEIGVGN
jgi:pimeloyl-[acyl-carrier protein] methyl ester esterase